MPLLRLCAASCRFSLHRQTNRHRICPAPQSVRVGTLELTSAAILAGSVLAIE
jgi:hypothetical protein